MTEVLRLLLGTTLLWAGAAKLVRPRAAAAALGPLGLPPRLPSLAGVAALELVLGGLLLGGLAVRPAAAAATVLGAAFVAVLLRAGRRGARRLPCACFGPGGRERPLALLVARAAGLAGLAAVVAAAPPAPSRSALLAGAVALLALWAAAVTVALAALARQVGVLHLRLPAQSALELAGEGPALLAAPPPLDGLRGRGDELVAFGAPSCRLCRSLEPGLRALAGAGLRVHLVDAEAAADAAARWAVPGTPYVVLLVDGVVAAKGLVNTLEQLEGLLALGRARMTPAAA